MPRFVLNLIVKVIGLVVRGARRLFGGGRRQPADAGAPSDGVAAEAPGPFGAPTGAGVAGEPAAEEGLWPSTVPGAPTHDAPTHDARTHDAPGHDAARDYGMPDYWPPAPGAAPTPDPRELRLRLVPPDVRRDHGVSDEIKQDERTVLAAMVQEPALRDELLLAFPPGAFSPEARSVRNTIGALHDLAPDEPIDVVALVDAIDSERPWLTEEQVIELGAGAAATGLATSAAVRAIRNDIIDELSNPEDRLRELRGEINPDLSPEEQQLAESNQLWSDWTGIDSDLGLPPELAHIQIAYTDNLAQMATGDTPLEVIKANAFTELPIWEQLAAREAWTAEHMAAAEPSAADAVAVASDALAGPEEGERTAETGSTVGSDRTAGSSRVAHGPRKAKPDRPVLTTR